RRLQYKSISIHSKEERIKIVKFIVPLYIVMLIAVVALVVVAAIMSGTGVELTNSLLDDGWSKEEIKNFLNTVSIDFEIDNELGIIYNVFFVILQYGWQLVFLCIGIYKCINISKFLKQKS
ncbi:MAG: hypothetical protein FWF58_02125, partial [Firmicutes bacterium]|nr:hypothetical protein [Bacillota bacterium]